MTLRDTQRNRLRFPVPLSRLSSIRVRLTLWYVLLLALILTMFSAVLYIVLDHGLDGRVDSELRFLAEQALNDVKQQNGQLIIQQEEGTNDLLTLAERGVLVRIMGIDGREIESVGPFRTLPAPPVALAAARQGENHFDEVNLPGEDNPIRLYTLPFKETGENGKVYGFIQVGESLEPVQDTLHRLLLIMAIVIPVTLILASIGGIFLASRALLPIDRITRTVQQINANDLKQRLNLTLPDDEVGRLARTFDAMLDRLEDAFLRQRQFTADASHELRTPLSIMKGNIEVALNRARSADEYMLVLSNMEEEVNRLTRLVEDLLLLARADAGHPLIHAEPVDLPSLLQVIANLVEPMLQAKGLSLNLQLPEALCLEGDMDKLMRLFINLLDNAIKFTPSGGKITIQANNGHPEHPDWVAVSISDSGPGVSSEQLAYIFERFHRADDSRSRGTGGYGLGLTLAKWLAEAHGGRIEVQSEQGVGSTFTVLLPRLVIGKAAQTSNAH